MDAIQTHYKFELPKGFLDDDGALLRDGIIRLATAADEIVPLGDSRVRHNPAYLPVLVLSRVIVRLGHHEGVTPHQVERLYSEDFRFLEKLYNDINHAAADSLVMEEFPDLRDLPGNVEALSPRTNSTKR